MWRAQLRGNPRRSSDALAQELLRTKGCSSTFTQLQPPRPLSVHIFLQATNGKWNGSPPRLLVTTAAAPRRQGTRRISRLPFRLWVHMWRRWRCAPAIHILYGRKLFDAQCSPSLEGASPYSPLLHAIKKEKTYRLSGRRSVLACVCSGIQRQPVLRAAAGALSHKLRGERWKTRTYTRAETPSRGTQSGGRVRPVQQDLCRWLNAQ